MITTANLSLNSPDHIPLTTVNSAATGHTTDIIASLLTGRKQGFTKL